VSSATIWPSVTSGVPFAVIVIARPAGIEMSSDADGAA
jgi:hypothetical protein